MSSGLIDRVVQRLRRHVYEVPVDFKWFVPVLFDGSCCFAGEESAGASFLRGDATVWATDKDGLIMGLLAAEMTVRTGKDPGEHYRAIEAEYHQDLRGEFQERGASGRFRPRGACVGEPCDRKRRMKPTHKLHWS